MESSGSSQEGGVNHIVDEAQSEERAALSNASIANVEIETREKQLTLKPSEQHHNKKRRGKVFPLETNRPFNGKQLKQKSLTDLKNASLILEMTNASKYKEVFFFPGLQDVNGNDLIIMDSSKLPNKADFRDRKVFKETNSALNLYAKAFITANVTSDHFVLIIHGLTSMPSPSTARKLYKMLKENFSERLHCYIIHKPELKMKVFINVCRPFLQNKMKRKLFTTKTELDFLKEHGIAESILDYRQ